MNKLSGIMNKSNRMGNYHSESETIQELRSCKYNFKSKLARYYYENILTTNFNNNMHKIFFCSCYYHHITYINDTYKYIGQLSLDEVITNIDGYSPLGAVIISKAPLFDKRYIIYKLVICGIKSTPKDRQLNALILYDSITESMKKSIMLLLGNKDVLTHDIRKLIINIWLKKLKGIYCPI